MADTQIDTSSLQKTIQTAVDTAFSNLQPQINDTVNEWTEKGLDAAQGAAKQVVRTAKNNPWYFFAGAAAIVILLGTLIGLQEREG